jgi:pimeloyl-ACP methyl ester carboxylesterase
VKHSIERVPVVGGRLRVITAGSGPSLVYLHGTGDRGELLPVLETLAERYTVIRPDHPGFLDSDDLGTSITDVAGIAGAQRELLDARGVVDFVLVGCSLGGWVAAELALAVPHRVSRLVLIDPAGLAGDGSAPDIFSLTPEEALMATVHDEAGRSAALATPPDPETVRRLARSRAAAHRIASEPYMHDPRLGERLRSLTTVPVDILWGREDGIVPVSYARAWQDVLPHARLTVVSGAGHLPHVEQPRSLLGILDQGVPPWN